MILSGEYDEGVIESIHDVVERWGGRYFYVKYSGTPLEDIKKFKSRGFCIVHLTMYGLPIQQMIEDIKSKCRDLVVVVGAEKVPREYYEVADYNIAIGNQPHSEVAALAIFLDRLFDGLELSLCFPDAMIRVEPQARGKKVVVIGEKRG